MAMQNANTNATTSPAAALWRIAVAEYEQAVAAYAVVCGEYEAACADYKGKDTAPDALTRYDAAEREHDAAVDVVHQAREKLYATPAPDAKAVVTKLDILAAYLAECEDEDTHRVAAIRDDAKRLFAGVA